MGKPVPFRGCTAAIEMRSISSLKPYERNARKHPAKQIRQIAESIKQFGFNAPILIDASGTVIAGHGRLEAAKRLRWTEVPTLLVDHMTQEQQRAYMLADNRLAENASWDPHMLRLEFGELIDLDIDVTLTGFEMPEIDKLLNPAIPDIEEEPPEPDLELPVVSKVGDLWLLGPHRLYCGDSLQADSYNRVLDGNLAQMVFSDPPFNVKIEGNVSGLGQKRHKEFVMASGEMSPAEFTKFLATTIGHLTNYTSNGSIHFLVMDWRHMREMLDAALPQYAEMKNLVIWSKSNAGMGSFYRSQHELIFMFKNGTEPHVNNVELGKHGRHRTNLWHYEGATTVRKGRAERLALHPTVKPVQMIIDAIKDCTDAGRWVLDAFGGSGSTLLAAHQTQRRAALIELDPRYVDVTVQRFQRHTGIQARHAGTGRLFDDIATATYDQAFNSVVDDEDEGAGHEE